LQSNLRKHPERSALGFLHRGQYRVRAQSKDALMVLQIALKRSKRFRRCCASLRSSFCVRRWAAMTKDAYLAFETGGTKLVAGVAGSDGVLIETRILAREDNDTAPHSLSRLIDAGAALRAEHEAKGAHFRSIGFGYGGQVIRSTQRVLACPHEVGWENIDVQAELRRAFELPIAIENDCKLAALAEARMGAGKGHRTVFYVTIGTGIGGGIVREGQIVDFGDAGEAEVGHMVVMPHDGFPCGCGNKGCLETIAAGPGMVTFAKKLAKDHAGDWRGNDVAQRAIHDKRFTAKDLMAAYEQTDLFAGVTMRVLATFIGQALANVIQIVNPDVIVIGGGVGASSERYVKMIGELTRQFVMPSLRDHCVFTRTTLRENVVTQGAALLAMRK
jgi:glucokinase